jgi:hypothetical protein
MNIKVTFKASHGSCVLISHIQQHIEIAVECRWYSKKKPLVIELPFYEIFRRLSERIRRTLITACMETSV